jgi:hypothetical protein
MKALKLTLILALVFIAIGCPTRSIHPLFTAKGLVFDASLLGTWIGSDGKETIVFERSGDKAYRVSFTEAAEQGKGESTQVFIVQLGNVGKTRYMDSTPAENVQSYYFIPTHLFSRISLNGDKLVIATLEGDRIRDLIDAGKLKIPHVRRDNEVILTGTPAELQKALLRLERDAKAFGDPSEYVRKK